MRDVVSATAAPMIVGLFTQLTKREQHMAEIERMTAEEVVMHLLEDADGADLVRESLRWLVQQ